MWFVIQTIENIPTECTEMRGSEDNRTSVLNGDKKGLKDSKMQLKKEAWEGKKEKHSDG